MDLSAAILVGRSTRMGRDKAFLLLNNETFIGHLAKELSACHEVFISTALEKDFSEYGLKVVLDENQNVGPMEGIRQSLRYADTDYVFICGVDLPFVRKEMMMYLSDFISSDYDAYIFRDEERVHPLCGIYSKAVLPVAEKMIGEGNYRMMGMLANVRTKYVNISNSCFPEATLRNINTPADYHAILRPMIFCVSGIKNSGKTHLTERLIHAFCGKGMSVGVIKHDGHSFECDVEGTDSDRFYRAGAVGTAVFSKSQSFVRIRRQMEIDDMIRQFGDVDAVIIEGMKNSSYPKIEVIRGEVSNHSVCDSTTLLCIATDTELSESVPCPIYDLNDTEGILACVMGKL